MPSILDDVDQLATRKKRPKYIKSMTMTVVERSETIQKVKLPNWEKGEFFIFLSNLPPPLHDLAQVDANFTFTGNSRMHWWADFVETIRGWKPQNKKAVTPLPSSLSEPEPCQGA